MIVNGSLARHQNYTRIIMRCTVFLVEISPVRTGSGTNSIEFGPVQKNENELNVWWNPTLIYYFET